MSDQFYTILTSLGKAKIANSGALGTKVNFVRFKVGDGGGAYYNPTETQTDVKNKVWEGNISSISIDESNPSWIVIETVIPTLDGGFTIREAGIFDDENNLIAIGKYPATYKPIAAEGSSKDLMIRMILEVSNAESVNLKVDPTVILATKKDIQKLESNIQETNAQFKDLVYQTAGGTGTAITLTMQNLVNGYGKTFIASYNNSGTATTINGKPLYKPGTTTAPNLITGKAYTVWYNSTGDCFFIKASAEGDAVASNVLAGKKFSNDIDTGLVGAMPNNGALGTILAINGIYTIPAGYTTGGTITQNITTKSAATYTPGTSNQTIAAGQYLSGIQTVLGDSDLIPNNIVKGKTIFNVTGTAISMPSFKTLEVTRTVASTTEPGYLYTPFIASKNSNEFYYADYSKSLRLFNISTNSYSGSLGNCATYKDLTSNYMAINNSIFNKSTGSSVATFSAVTSATNFFTDLSRTKLYFYVLVNYSTNYNKIDVYSVNSSFVATKIFTTANQIDINYSIFQLYEYNGSIYITIDDNHELADFIEYRYVTPNSYNSNLTHTTAIDVGSNGSASGYGGAFLINGQRVYNSQYRSSNYNRCSYSFKDESGNQITSYIMYNASKGILTQCMNNPNILYSKYDHFVFAFNHINTNPPSVILLTSTTTIDIFYNNIIEKSDTTTKIYSF